MIIPWFVVWLIDIVAWPLGYQTYVRARGGSGWHAGRFGAERVYFIKREYSTVRPKPLKRRALRPAGGSIVD